MKLINKLLFSAFSLGLMAFAVSCGEKEPEHHVSSNWKMNEQEHWHECKDEGCTEHFEQAAHNFEVVEDVTATCTVDGYKTYKCTVCNYSYKADEVTHTGHDLELHEKKDATCTEDGNTAYYSCKNCNHYYEDELAQKEIEANSWVISAEGHDLEHIEAKEATITSAGYIEHYHCKTCDHYYSDPNGLVEITKESVVSDQLIASVAQAREAKTGDKIIVRGIVTGYTATAASKNLVADIVLKDENSNVAMALSGGADSSNALYAALGKNNDLKAPYEVGTVLEIPVVVTKSDIKYANGNAYLDYLVYDDNGEELSSYVKGTASAKYDLTDETIQVIDNQADFFKFLGLLNGSNDADSEGFVYSAETAGSNAFKIIKLENLQGVLQTDPSTTADEKRNWRPMFGDEYDTWAKSSISNSANATNKIGAKQSFYPVFNNYNTWFNTGKTFSELVFGENAATATYRAWANHTDSVNDCYVMFVGGSDYYCQFAILDADWVVEKAPAPITPTDPEPEPAPGPAPADDHSTHE